MNRWRVGLPHVTISREPSRRDGPQGIRLSGGGRHDHPVALLGVEYVPGHDCMHHRETMQRKLETIELDCFQAFKVFDSGTADAELRVLCVFLCRHNG